MQCFVRCSAATHAGAVGSRAASQRGTTPCLVSWEFVFRPQGLTLAVSCRAMDGLPHGYKRPLARSAPVLC